MIDPAGAGIYFEHASPVIENTSVTGASHGGIVGVASVSFISETAIIDCAEDGILLQGGWSDIHDNEIWGTTSVLVDNQQLYGDGASFLESPGHPMTATLHDNVINYSDRAGVSSFGANVTLGDNGISCSALDLDGGSRTASTTCLSTRAATRAAAGIRRRARKIRARSHRRRWSPAWSDPTPGWVSGHVDKASMRQTGPVNTTFFGVSRRHAEADQRDRDRGFRGVQRPEQWHGRRRASRQRYPRRPAIDARAADAPGSGSGSGSATTYAFACAGNTTPPTVPSMVAVTGSAGTLNTDLTSLIMMNFVTPYSGPVELCTGEPCTDTNFLSSTAATNGAYSFSVATNSAPVPGYVEIPAAGSGSAATLLTLSYVGTPYVKDTVVPFTVLAPQAAVALAQNAGARCTTGAGLGFVTFKAVDCNGTVITDSTNVHGSLTQNGSAAGDPPIDIYQTIVAALASAGYSQFDSQAAPLEGIFIVCGVPARETTVSVSYSSGSDVESCRSACSPSAAPRPRLSRSRVIDARGGGRRTRVLQRPVGEPRDRAHRAGQGDVGAVMNRSRLRPHGSRASGSKLTVFEDGTFRALTDDEWRTVVIREPAIRMRGEGETITEHRAPDGVAFTARDLADAIAKTEHAGRGSSEWFGGIDVHHTFFEGIEDEDGVWSIRWGS